MCVVCVRVCMVCVRAPVSHSFIHSSTTGRVPVHVKVLALRRTLVAPNAASAAFESAPTLPTPVPSLQTAEQQSVKQ